MIYKYKVKWSRYRPCLAQRVDRVIALLFHDRGNRRGWVVSSSPRPRFTSWKDPVSILKETVWAPGAVWTGGKFLPHRDSIPDSPARSQSLYRLSYQAHTHTHTHIYIYFLLELLMSKFWPFHSTVTEDFMSLLSNFYYNSKKSRTCKRENIEWLYVLSVLEIVMVKAVRKFSFVTCSWLLWYFWCWCWSLRDSSFLDNEKYPNIMDTWIRVSEDL